MPFRILDSDCPVDPNAAENRHEISMSFTAIGRHDLLWILPSYAGHASERKLDLIDVDFVLREQVGHVLADVDAHDGQDVRLDPVRGLEELVVDQDLSEDGRARAVLHLDNPPLAVLRQSEHVRLAPGQVPPPLAVSVS